MKKNSLLALVAAVLLVFTSCSNEETTPLENESTSLLKAFEIKKDATGAYSVNFDVSNNTKIDKFTDITENKSEFILSSSQFTIEKSRSEELLIDNNKLKVGFVDVNSNDRKLISITDDNFTFQSKSDNTEKLIEYSILGNEDGTYNLAFSVNDNVEVSFVYNEAISTYEVHLEDGKIGEINYSRTLEKESNAPLKLDFVNHITNTSAKSSESESSAETRRKPRIIIDEGEEL
ncbi:hypothetical protein BW723_01250 [Polaribacter reichenbachii]|uniref:Lipoprotein n=1 Tax=Polaribacter reichenbachii TaxID=996801 RepID=A0A1B8TWL5_9FLAO|nr:hypothetical protein [Polaribacter reichenbachii]APZ44999.1 hypothetical protein BW723_01250 [Polaribacter reichenbachii]AUC18862.1 hypothetical protein BTO17_09255 [Polaribacter reichenbachii]OBY63980.1 hypothetical protein LPB301_14440 [Polaribacter reichenbachii]